MFDESENLKGKASHLALAVLENCRLRVFVATDSKHTDMHMK